MMRIGLVTAYDLSRDGGVNRHVLGLARALRQLGDDVLILGPASGAVPVGECTGLPGVVKLPGNGSMAHVGLAVRRQATCAWLRQGDFDVVHLHAPFLPGPARQALLAATAPMVATFHMSAAPLRGLWGNLVRRVAAPLRRLGQGIAVSEAARRTARQLYAGPLSVIPNGIVLDDFLPTPRPLRPAFGEPLRVLFVGRFDEPRKGLRDLLLAVSALRQSGKAVALSIVGAGRRDQFAALAVSANAQFLGRLDDTCLARAYREADIFCAPSTDRESFGLVLIEAMASDCPVVACDIDGYREAAQDCALLVPPRDPVALAAALWRLGSDTSKRQAQQALGRQRAAALDWRRVAPRVRQIYRQLLSAASAQPSASAGRPSSRRVG